jgi:hypothetical protein
MSAKKMTVRCSHYRGSFLKADGSCWSRCNLTVKGPVGHLVNTKCAGNKRECPWTKAKAAR